jgi:hypothetical protein
MTQGLLGKAALAANTYTKVYQVTTGKTATANIKVINNDLVNSVSIRLYICPVTWVSGAGGTSDIIEPLDLVIQAGKVLENTGIAMSGGEQVVAFTLNGNVTVRVHGFEN